MHALRHVFALSRRLTELAIVRGEGAEVDFVCKRAAASARARGALTREERHLPQCPRVAHDHRAQARAREARNEPHPQTKAPRVVQCE